MFQQLLLKSIMHREIERLRITKSHMEKQLVHLPHGSISKKGTKMYHSYRDLTDGKQHMVAASSSETLNGLKVKRQIQMSLPIIEERIDNCNKFIENDIMYDPVKVELQLPENYRGGKHPCLWLPGDIDPEEWANDDYISNPMEIINPKETNGGRRVRSKSESIVGTVAEDVCLFHRYEQQIIIMGEVFYPDFIFCLPMTRRLIYYEHFGKMDDPYYVKKAAHKLEMYPHYGLFLGYNFFATFETKESTFSFPEAKKIIQKIMNLDCMDVCTRIYGI